MTPLDHARELIALREKGDYFNAAYFAADHAAGIAAALIESEARIARMRRAFAEWESVRTFRNDINSHEWLALIDAMEDAE